MALVESSGAQARGGHAGGDEAGATLVELLVVMLLVGVVGGVALSGTVMGMDTSRHAQERLDAAIEWANEYRALAPMSGMNQIWPSDFIRWREVSLRYDTPSSLYGSLGLRNLSVSLRARNVAMWVNDDYRGIDPELEEVGPCDSVTGVSVDCNFQMGQEAWRFPIPRRLILAVRAGF
jgi:hypothetical protein